MRITHVTIIEPDVYKAHNVERHYFGHESVGTAPGGKVFRSLGFVSPESHPSL